MTTAPQPKPRSPRLDRACVVIAHGQDAHPSQTITTHEAEAEATAGSALEGDKTLSTHETPAKTPGNAYVLAGNATARDVFNRRTVHQDAALVVPHRRPGMRLVDFGCGAGSLTCGFASLVAPGEVFGFDVSADAIDRGKSLVEESGLTNVQFSVATINDLDLPAETFDVAHFSGVLMHLQEPERALRLPFQCLKSGGLLAAREAEKAGDWFGGPCAESVALFRRVASEGIKAAGGDPFLGRRLLGLVREAGFERLEAMPGYSPALADVTAGAEALALRPRDVRRHGLVLPNRKNPSRPVKTAHLAVAHAGLPVDLLLWAREHDLGDDEPLFFSRQRAPDGRRKAIDRVRAWQIVKAASARAEIHVLAPRASGHRRVGEPAPVHPHLFCHARVRQIVRHTRSLALAQKQAGWARLHTEYLTLSDTEAEQLMHGVPE